MRILRVLNTNAIMIRDSQGQEVVLLGSGLGFKKRPGDLFDASRVEKAFHLTNKVYQKRFQELINSIPDIFILIAEQIISYGKETFHFAVSESIHVSLADHIKQAIDNHNDGFHIPNTILHEIKRCYNNEFQTALYGLRVIKEKTGVDLPEDEAGFIAMHFVTAVYSKTGMSVNAKKMIQITSGIHDIVQADLNLNIDRDSLIYRRYITHLNFFAERIIRGDSISSKTGSELLDSIKQKYPQEYICSKKIASFVQENYHYFVSDDEVMYLLVHLAQLQTIKGGSV